MLTDRLESLVEESLDLLEEVGTLAVVETLVL